MIKKELKQRLFEVAELEARELGYIFPESVKSALEEMISSSIDRLPFEDINSDGKVQLIETNMKKLVKYVCINTQQESYEKNVINYRSLDPDLNPNLNPYLDVRAFNAVRLSICPLWPFC